MGEGGGGTEVEAKSKTDSVENSYIKQPCVVGSNTLCPQIPSAAIPSALRNWKATDISEISLLIAGDECEDKPKKGSWVT